MSEELVASLRHRSVNLRADFSRGVLKPPVVMPGERFPENVVYPQQCSSVCCHSHPKYAVEFVDLVSELADQSAARDRERIKALSWDDTAKHKPVLMLWQFLTSISEIAHVIFTMLAGSLPSAPGRPCRSLMSVMRPREGPPFEPGDDYVCLVLVDKRMPFIPRSFKAMPLPSPICDPKSQLRAQRRDHPRRWRPNAAPDHLRGTSGL